MSRITPEIVLQNLKDNPLFFIEALLWIKTKRKELIPFKLNKEQKKIYAAIERQRKEGKPVRIIVLKCRQFGCSTLSEALIFQDTATHPNVASLVIAHDKESAVNIYRMSKLFYDKLDKDIYKPMVSASNRQEIIFENPNKKDREKNPGLRSYIRVETAGNFVQRSFTYHNLHISELAFWQNPDDVMDSLLQSVPDEPNTMIIVESTANGIGNYFYQMWQDAKAGKNDFEPIFVAWWEVDEYSKTPPKDFELYNYDHPNYGNEVAIMKRYNLTLDQMYWRRYTIKNKMNNKLKVFQQEYPADDMEAFIVTGSSVFDFEVLKDYKQVTQSVTPFKGELRWFQASEPYDKDGQSIFLRNGVEFVPRSDGRWLIWKFPETNDGYAIGADVAEGLSTGNFSAAEVLSRKHLAQVAEFHGHLRPEVYAEELAKAGYFFNNALIAVEANNHGLTTLSYLKDEYPYLYYDRGSKMGGGRARRLGWYTTRKTKSLMIDKLDKNLRDRDIVILSPYLIDELSKYTEKEDGSMEAGENAYDDRVMALAIANYILDEVSIAGQDTNVHTYGKKRAIV